MSEPPTPLKPSKCCAWCHADYSDKNPVKHIWCDHRRGVKGRR